MSRRRLLLLSGGCMVGQNVLAALSERRDRVHLTATSSIADEPALFAFDAVYLVPVTAADPATLERRVEEIVEQERIDLVVPCRDDDVLFLAALNDRRADLAGRLLCGGHEAAETMSDKWLAYRFCASRGLPFVESLHRSSAEERAAFVRAGGLPCVAKPRRSFASRGIRMLWTDDQLERALDDENCVVQRFIGDQRAITDFLADIEAGGIPLAHTFQTFKHSIQALIAADGAVVSVICTRNRLDLRRAKRVEPDETAEARSLGARCAEAFSSAGWRGPLNIQCMRAQDGRLQIHEFNGRFTGATAVRWRLGFDEVGIAVEQFTGRPLGGRRSPATPARMALEGFASRAADPRAVETLARDGCWRKEETSA